MTNTLTGHDAIHYAEQRSVPYLWKRTDPIEEARWVRAHQAREIAAEDPGLIVAVQVGDHVEAGEPDTEDYDSGVVTWIAGEMVTVAWDSEVRTTQRVTALRWCGPRRWDDDMYREERIGRIMRDAQREQGGDTR